ncbi:MAG: HAMP domain-containing protein [Bryobacterales bacterium]|nr:HAMP domain-containing protein [Bryobacterales bacterium]
MRTENDPRFRFGLAAKLALCLLPSAVIVSALFGWVNLRLQRQGAEELIFASADRVSDIIRRSTRFQMLHNDREALYQTIRDIGSEPGINVVRIFNGEGQIQFSTLLEEVGTSVDKDAEACYMCHAHAEPLTRLPRPDRARIFVNGAGERVLAVIRPIENEPSCSDAPCHAHPASQQVLGVIDAQLSLAAVDVQSARQRELVLLFSILAIILLSAASLIFVWRVVHRPVKELTTGAAKVAAGNLDHRLTPRSSDELGRLAVAFNEMTSRLSAAYRQIERRAETLEENVETKTRELERTQTFLFGSERLASLGKLAATVAHEVNNPLFGILTYARLSLRDLEAGEVSPEARERLIDQLRVVERESKRCGEIMRNLLSFARQSPRQLALADINELVRRSAKLVQHRAEMQGIFLGKDLAEDLPEVHCEAGQIQQVLLALLVNACDAMPSGGELTVTTRRNGDGVTVVVRDSGTGIPAEDLPQIFEPFFTTKEDDHGTGLGLAVAKSIVDRHGGTIGVESAPGQGTVFTIGLPLTPPPETVPATAVEQETA